MLQPEDLPELEKRRISPSDLEKQASRLKQGTRPLNIIRPCSLEDGIDQLSDNQKSSCETAWDEAVRQGRASKFIPASGAATRMFQALYQNVDDPTQHQQTMQELGTSLHRFPFFKPLSRTLSQQGLDMEALRHKQDFKPILEALLSSEGLNYTKQPKALLPFHRYPTEIRTALEEHVHEGIRLLQDSQGIIRCHVTVSPEHLESVQQHLCNLKAKLGSSGHVLAFSLSVQTPQTETIALDTQGNIVRTETGKLLFRPGGHGALIRNLSEYQGDIILISNIDNVVPDHLKPSVLKWRAMLGGYLTILQTRIFSLWTALANAPHPEPVLRECEAFLERELKEPLPAFYAKWTTTGQAAFFQGYFNRPLRVCGMVKNTGDPGGGPFWVEDQTGTISKQIVEQAQIASDSPTQQELFTTSTHFNPVDMACGVRDFLGRPFDLTQFIDPDTVFVAKKSYKGKPITVLEWPGLWNGGMANWITVFVDIPRSAFNPVKTYLDWLHLHHQPLS